MTEPFRRTEEQEAIVAHPAVPLRVAAGAGTGKTTTVVLRLKAQIDAGIQPEEALGITFTNKAAEELADRLRSELPGLAREGREVQVTTYHGFAFGLIQEFGALVGVERNTAVIGPGYQRQLVEEALAGGRYRHLDLTAVAQRVEDAVSLGRQLGDNLLLPSDLSVAAPRRRDDVWDRRLELGQILQAYRKGKERLGVVDYSDLVRIGHDLLTSHPEVASRVRDRYRVVVLDEYQDTDPGQRLLLQALFGNGFPVSAVGDPDQTIYEWRGASRHNFAGFPEDFPDERGRRAATLPLTLNRRSDRNVIELANRVRTRISGSDEFEPLRPAPGAGTGSIEYAWLHTEREEAEWVAGRIHGLHDDGLRWADIAVLFRKNRSIVPVRDALLAAGIPVDVVSLGGLLTVPEVMDLHAWLRILHDPDDSAALARILLGGKYRLGLRDFAPLYRWVREHRTVPDAEESIGWPLVEAVDRLDEVNGLSTQARRRLVLFRDRYRRLLVEAQGTSLVELCRRVLRELDAWTEANSLDDHAALSARLNLYRFLDLAEEWSPLEGRPSLRGFLGYLEVLEDENAAEELDTATVSREDAVSLLTVHRAKGLEWDAVFLPALAKGIFPAGPGRYDNPVDSPRSLPYEMRIDRAALPDLTGASSLNDRRHILRSLHDDQEWRTAYVAVTRARHRLVLSGAYWTGGVKPRERSELYEIAAESPGANPSVVVSEPGPAPEPEHVDARLEAPDPLFPDGWAAALRAASRPGWLDRFPEHSDAASTRVDQLRLDLGSLPEPPADLEPEPFSTSVTGLVTMAACPLRFRWSHVDRLPRRPAPHLRHGTEFHRRVELHNLGRVPIEDFDDATYDLDARTPQGQVVQAGPGPFEVFLASRFATMSPRFVEVPIDLQVGPGRVRGRIDAVYEPEPSAWEIVDYKSGPRRDDPALSVQLQAYAVAAADGAIAASPPDRLTVSFAYFGGGTLDEVGDVVDAGWLASARRHVEGLVDQAVAGDFPATPSDACRSCDFLTFCDPGRKHVDRLD